MWNKELETARRAAKAAGKILSDSFGFVNNVMKKGAIDLVTDADLEAEKVVLETIQDDFPADNILSEEAGNHQHASSDRTWIVDPLDGTTNFAHGFPFFAVSIALAVENETVLGVVYNPCMEEFFLAQKGQGTFLNGEPLHVTETAGLEDALLATGFPYDVHEHPDRVMTLFKRFLVRAQGIRRLGTAALDMCYVAAGRLDGFWEQDLHPWDTAAGDILVREAGGHVTTFSGGAYTPYEKTVLASNGLIHEDMVAVVSK